MDKKPELKKIRLCWKYNSPQAGLDPTGESAPFHARPDIKDLIDNLNKHFPFAHHWIEEVEQTDWDTELKGLVE